MIKVPEEYEPPAIRPNQCFILSVSADAAASFTCPSFHTFEFANGVQKECLVKGWEDKGDTYAVSVQVWREE